MLDATGAAKGGVGASGELSQVGMAMAARKRAKPTGGKPPVQRFWPQSLQNLNGHRTGESMFRVQI